jgi:hypothetical protein
MRHRSGSRRIAGLVVAASSVLVLAAPASARVEVVTHRDVAFRHFTSIQRAVRAAHAGDWILVDRGRYTGSVVIRKDRLHVRGLDRNRVVLDGRHRKDVNGIEVSKADGVSIENLTVRNFDRRGKDGENGNEIWWNGGDGSGRIGMHGWYGRYLTAYDTGVTGGYGLFASNAVRGWWKHVYASGFDDSGLYIGACRDCRALVRDALSERNALGYSGTNAGGHLVVERSVFRHNAYGVAPNSLNNDDQPPPQDGACNAGANRTALPTFATTHVARCTVFRHNVIADNNNLTTPESSGSDAPWGVGIELPGDYADLFRHNTIRGNVNFGVLAFENPNPFPPTSNTIDFQLSGNRISDNRFRGNGTAAGGADVALEGGVFGTKQSVNNCFSGNHLATTIPAKLEGAWGCQNATTPNGDAGLVGTIVSLEAEAKARHPRGQPAPSRQPRMPHPCRGVPRNPLCG